MKRAKTFMVAHPPQPRSDVWSGLQFKLGDGQ